MNNYIFFNQIKKENILAKFLFFAFIFFFQLALADGTRQVSPGNGSGTATANGTALYVSPAGGAVGVTGSFPGSSVESKLRVTISDHNSENIYAGFMARTYGGGGSSAPITDAYVRISTEAGVQVFQAAIPASGTGAITSYSQAWNGPNIGGSNTSGYTPFTFDPTSNGEYIIELYRGTNNGNTVNTVDAATFPYFDITVASGAGTQASPAVPKPGRLWCRDWGFVTTNLLDPGFPNIIDSSFDGDFFVYTNDGFKAKVDFQTGFKPFAFRLIMNFEGIGTTGNFINDSKSRNGTFTAPNTIAYPTLPSGYRVFLTTPDPVAFPNGDVGSPAITGNIYGCPGAYFIPYYTDRVGDVAILLDLNGTPGFQPNTADRVLEAYSVPVGSNVMLWNGLNGLGAAVTTNASASVTVTLLRGRINLPVLDGELNSNGLIATAVYPNLGNRQLFWDDSLVTPFGAQNPVTNTGNNANITTATANSKTSNLLFGILGPSHAWDGSNPNTTTPAPVTTGQGSTTPTIYYDDFGNGRIINTWFYGSQANSGVRNSTIPSCDNDGDGIPDNTDLDDDNDGILDTLEYGFLPDPFGDHDADGVPNYIDPQAPGFIDTNFDGVDDRYDLDLDGIINQFDTDSDGDGCADAIEGSEYVTAAQIYPLTLASTDINYRFRGQINVLANGTATGTPAQFVSTVAAANGVPLLVNPAASNTGNVAGVADNTDGTSDIGQGLGLSQNAARSGCLDTDGDGIPDEDDLDDDNDGILDSLEGLCATSSVQATDGFDDPVVPALNANNLQNVNPYNGWTAVDVNTGVLLGPNNIFNIIKVDGTAYSEGPDFAQSGNQYVDINGAARIYKQFTFTTRTVVNASAWFANRATSDGGYVPYSTRIEIINTNTGDLVLGNLVSFTKIMGDEGWYQSSISNVVLPAGTYRIRMLIDNYSHVDSISYCFSTDTDGDGIPNHLDTDSDDDGCPDAIEGSETVTYPQVHALTLPSTDANYNFRGQIKVLGNGTTPGTPAQIISTKYGAGFGVPLLVNNANGNHTNTAGVADNTDNTIDVGQGVGNSQTATVNDCKCYKTPNITTGTNNETLHGVTAFNRAGVNNSNWPMVRNNGWTALESNTKPFVMNRMPVATTTAGTVIAGEPITTSPNAPVFTSPIVGMTFYDTTNDCLKINIDGTRTGWRCFNAQACPDAN